MNKIAIYGAGGFGRETVLLIHQINELSAQWNVIGFYDDGIKPGTPIDGLSVIGGSDDLSNLTEPMAIVIAIADPQQRYNVVSKIVNPKVTFPSLIHPRAIINNQFNAVGKGCIITSNCIFTTGIKLGDFVIVNLASTIGHDTIVGDYCCIMPGNHISGNCRIGEGTMMGTGAVMIQNLQIGNHCKVGAGAVVISSFENNVTIVGVPAKIVKRDETKTDAKGV